MLEKLGVFSVDWVKSNSPWTNVYGLARTIIALTLALTLSTNSVGILFHPAAGVPEYPQCENIDISIFCLVPSDYFYLNIIKWVSVILLLIVASGWRPRITGIILAWIAYSFHNSAITVDGGEQVAMVISLLLVPLSLTDPRKWHWSSLPNDYYKNGNMFSILIAKVNVIFLRIQASIIYFHAFVGKLKGEWLNGTAVYYFLNDSMLGALPILSKPLNAILTSNLVVFVTWGTLVIEALLFIGIVLPKKYWKHLLFLGILLHSGIAIVIGLYSFSLTMIALLILYFRPSESEFQFINKFKKIEKNNTNIKSFKGGDLDLNA